MCISRLKPGATHAPQGPKAREAAQGFRSPYRPRREGAVRFGELLGRVAAVDREMRIRFTSPHPKDFSDDVLEVLASPAGVFSGKTVSNQNPCQKKPKVVPCEYFARGWATWLVPSGGLYYFEYTVSNGSEHEVVGPVAAGTTCLWDMP